MGDIIKIVGVGRLRRTRPRRRVRAIILNRPPSMIVSPRRSRIVRWMIDWRMVRCRERESRVHG